MTLDRFGGRAINWKTGNGQSRSLREERREVMEKVLFFSPP